MISINTEILPILKNESSTIICRHKLRFWVLTTMKICINIFILIFKYLLLNTDSLLNIFFIILLTFSHILLSCFSNFSSLTKKRQGLGIIKMFYISNHLWKFDAQMFFIFVSDEIFLILFSRSELLRQQYLINIHIVYSYRVLRRMKLLSFDFNKIEF